MSTMRTQRWLFILLAIGALNAHAQPATPAIAEKSLAIPETDEGLPGVGPIRRYDWFQNLWLQKRSGWVQRIAQDQGAVVFLGDSITQGWKDDFQGKFEDVKVANRGISGDTTRGMLIRLQQDVLSLDPAAVVMLMGTNDLEELATPEQVAANFQLIIERLKQHDAQMPIVVCEVFPSSAEKKRSSDQIKLVNALYRKAVQGDPQITVIDTWTLFANELGDAKAEEFPAMWG